MYFRKNPSTINTDQFKEASLSLWPFIADRVRLENGEHYMI
jgi:hypothetical protein